jgi:hypothetical protein
MEIGLRDALRDISESDRSEMYRHIRSLHVLNQLVFYPYANIISAFEEESDDGSVSVVQIRSQLLELGDILVAQGRPPGGNALKALFSFHPRMAQAADVEKTAEQLHDFVAEARRGLAGIRTFASFFPLRKMLKVVSGSIGYTPEIIGGGEDWFALYRMFWEERIERELEVFSFRNRKKRLVAEACKLLGMDALPQLDYYRSKDLQAGIEAKFEITMAFLRSFVERLFLTEMNRALKIFLVDGDFYKSQNRQEFSDSYDGIRRSLDIIKRFVSDLSPKGETGRDISLVAAEVTDAKQRLKRLRDIYQKVDIEADKIINNCRGHLVLLISVVKGILFGESGGRYDTLSNISYIGGSENSEVLDRLNGALKQAEEAQRIFNELYDLELNASE